MPDGKSPAKPLELLSSLTGVLVPFVSSRSSGNSSWEIPVTSQSDEGFYECTATSKVGATRARAFVSVTGQSRRARGTFGSVCNHSSVSRAAGSPEVSAPVHCFYLMPKAQCLGVGQFPGTVSGSDSAQVGGGLTPMFGFPPAEPPPRLLPPGNITAVPGAGVIMSCLVLGGDVYNLTWHRDGQLLQADESRVRVLGNLSLEINSVHLGDSGRYECLVSNEHGTANASIWLVVQGKQPRLCAVSEPCVLGCCRSPVRMQIRYDSDLVGGPMAPPGHAAKHQGS